MASQLPDEFLAEVLQSGLGDLEFRAITTGRGRHGIRLEKAYWKALSEILRQEDTNLADLVAALKDSAGSGMKNLTAMLRLLCLVRQNRLLNRFRMNSGEVLARRLVRASPAPSLALSAEKKLLSWNEAFVALIRTGFGIQSEMERMGELRLALDIPIQTLLQVMAENPGEPIKVGAAIGLLDRRIRRTLNVVSLPSSGSGIVVAYVLDG